MKLGVPVKTDVFEGLLVEVAAVRDHLSKEIVLTQQDAPVLVHFSAERVETFLLVQLEAPDNENNAG